MKKITAIFIACILLLTTFVVGATAGVKEGFTISFNGEKMEFNSLIYNGIHHVPLGEIFEKMGAVVFYSESDNKIFALSRDGDIITHSTASNVVFVNGEEKIFFNPSILVNEKIYIPLDMVLSIFYPDEIKCDESQIYIQKQLADTDYHKIIGDILALNQSDDFNPENFQKYISFYINNPKYSPQDAVFRVNLGLDAPFYQNIKIIEHPHELLVLVNKYNKLPSGFMQYNLVKMDKKHTANDGKQYLLLDTVYEKYIKMSDAAKKDGLTMRVVSAYRTEEYQKNLYNKKVRTSGKTYADNYSARAGHSEHQTGLAVDIGSTKGTFEYTAEFRWLKKHAHEYGFILRYPKGKEWITGYSYEPWHYRYVGEDVAKIIYEEDITYEEYCAKYLLKNNLR